MSTLLTSLLDILENADNPGFQQAVDRLPEAIDSLDLTTLPADQRTALLARLEHVIGNLQTQKNLTAEQLGNLRNRGRALQSYTNRG
ncbi:MAG: hypothetical protein DI585_06855 [Pseudomonas fluorescens]|nr:MAG: hypothetical protein DI585_06855 [Pseudomonas fluorescens]